MAQPGPQPAHRTVREWAPAVVLATLIVAAYAYVLPKAGRNPLIEATVWALGIVTSFAGWGSLVRRIVAPKERIDLGLRVAWGASVLCLVGGALMVPALMTRAVAFLLVEAGAVLALISLALERRAVCASLRVVGGIVRRAPGIAFLMAGAAAVVAGQFLAGVSDWRTNPYDDDIAYIAFVRKLLDTGTVLEPFSLRRLSALGGQTFFQELVALRVPPSEYHTFDRSIAVLMVVLLVVGHGSGARRPPLLLKLLAVVMFVVLPSMAINTASYYSGVAIFLALFRTTAWAEGAERPAWRSALPLALVAVTACTLRQNYFVVVAVMLAASYAFRLFSSSSSEPISKRLAEPAMAMAFSLLALAPWFIVAWQSNRTFFYPLMLGTANPALLLNSDSTSLFHEIYLVVWTLLDGTPIHVFVLFIVAAALSRENASRRPLGSLAIATGVGVVALIHGGSQVEVESLRRYVFGFLAALALAVVLTAGASWRTPFRGRLERSHLASAIAFFALLVEFVAAREKLVPACTRAFNDIENLSHAVPHSEATEPPAQHLYHSLQESLPSGVRLAVMLDEPFWFDFRRNPIWNLDMPGFSSLPPGIPYFAGSDRIEEYFRGLGVRYLAYVRPGFSRYHFRREYWLGMLIDEHALWRAHGPYLIDFIDSLEQIRSRHRRLFEEQGLVVVDLEGGT